MSLKPEKLSKMFGAFAALAFEAPVRVHFDVLSVAPMPARTGTISSPIERPKWAGRLCQLSMPLPSPRRERRWRKRSSTFLHYFDNVLFKRFDYRRPFRSSSRSAHYRGHFFLHAEGLTILSGLVEPFHPAAAGLTITEHSFIVLNVVSKKIFCRRKLP